MGFVERKLSKIPIDKKDIWRYYKKNRDQKEESLLKIMAHATKQPKIKKLEIKHPEQEQTLIKKLEGKITTSGVSYQLLKDLVDSYQNEELKINNKMTRLLRKIFLEKLSIGLGKQRLGKLIKPKFWNMETQTLEMHSDSSSGLEFDDNLTDASFESFSLAPINAPNLPKKSPNSPDCNFTTLSDENSFFPPNDGNLRVPESPLVSSLNS